MTSKRRRQAADHRVRTILEEIQPGFVESGAKTITMQDVELLVERSDEVLAKFADGGALMRYAKQVESMVSLVDSYARGEYPQLPLWTVGVIAFVLLYVLKPIDIIPDSLPVIGQLDDAIVVAHGLDLVRRQLEAYEDWRRQVRA